MGATDALINPVALKKQQEGVNTDEHDKSCRIATHAGEQEDGDSEASERTTLVCDDSGKRCDHQHDMSYGSEDRP